MEAATCRSPAERESLAQTAGSERTRDAGVCGKCSETVLRITINLDLCRLEPYIG